MEHQLTGRPLSNLNDDSRPQVDVRQLMGGHREITIKHAGQDYRLRITRNGKLILTK
jgi:hemin uptake protein HemP